MPFETNTFAEVQLFLAAATILLPFILLLLPKQYSKYDKLIILFQIICLSGIFRAPIQYAGSLQGYYWIYSNFIMTDLTVFLLLPIGAYATMYLLKRFYFIERTIAFLSLFLFLSSAYRILI